MGDLNNELCRPKSGKSEVDDEAVEKLADEWKAADLSSPAAAASRGRGGGGGGENPTEIQEAELLEMEVLRKLSGQMDVLRETLDKIVSQANEEKNKQQAVIDLEKKRLEKLELQHRQTAEVVMESTGGGEEHRGLSIRYREELDELEKCRRTVDDLEFQLLETESRYEDQKETVHKQFVNDQLLLTDVYKRHQNVRKDRTNEEFINTLRLELSWSPTLPPTSGGLLPYTIAEATKQLRLAFLDVQANDVIDQQRRRLEQLRTGAAVDAHLAWNRKRMTSSPRSDAHLDRDSARPSPPATDSSSEGGGGAGGEAGSPKDRVDASESRSQSEGSNSSEQMSSVSSVSYGNENRVAEILKQLETAQAEKLLLLRAHVQQNAGLEELSAERRRHEELEARLREELAKQCVEPGTVKLRQEKRQQARPLTRYLPVRNGQIDLPEFLEQCGHHFEQCRDLVVSSHSARGLLTKMGGRIKTWRRRWFVFDRTERHLAYYVDRTERRRRGCIPFQDIDDVYVDHRRNGDGARRSPNPELTFCVKTRQRTYRMVAPTSEARQIWIDVIFTGAEGYQEFV